MADLGNVAQGAAALPKDVVHTAAKELETGLDAVNGLVDRLASVVTSSAGVADTEAKALIEELTGKADQLYTQITDLLHLSKPATPPQA